jgi:hypothetical protein
MKHHKGVNTTRSFIHIFFTVPNVYCFISEMKLSVIRWKFYCNRILNPSEYPPPPKVLLPEHTELRFMFMFMFTGGFWTLFVSLILYVLTYHRAG